MPRLGNVTDSLPVVSPRSICAFRSVSLDMLGNLNDALLRRDRALPTMRLEVPIHKLRLRMRGGRGLQPRIQLHRRVVQEICIRVAGKEIEVVLELRTDRGPVAL